MTRRRWLAKFVAVAIFMLLFAPGLGRALSGATSLAALAVLVLIGGVAAGIAYGIVMTVYDNRSAHSFWRPAPVHVTLFLLPVGLYTAVVGTSAFDSGQASVTTAKAQAAEETRVAKLKADAASVAAEQARTAAAEKARIAAMSPEERRARDEAILLESANEMVRVEANDSKHIQASLAGWVDMEKKLAAIAGDSPRHSAAQSLLATMSAEDERLADEKLAVAKRIEEERKQQLAEAKAREAEENRQAATLAKSLEPQQIAKRKEFATKLEQAFLEDYRMDTTVRATGPKSTALSIKWALVSRVQANDLSKTGLLDKARELGFTSVRFFNGFESELAEGYTWKL